MTTPSRGGGRGNTPRGKRRGKGKVSLPLSYTDDEGFTIVAKTIAKKRGGCSASSSSHQEVIFSQQAKTLDEVVVCYHRQPNIKIYTLKNICSGVSKDRSLGEYSA